MVGRKTVSRRPACQRTRASSLASALDDDLLHRCMHRALARLTSHSSSLACLVSSASNSRLPAVSSLARLRYPTITRTCSRTIHKTMASPATGSTPSSKVQQPEWIPPTSECPEPVLRVWNSLTKSKVRPPPFLQL